MTAFKVALLHQLKPRQGRVVWAGTTKIALFLIDNQVYAIKNFCPHAGGSLGTGPVRGLVVSCPRHAWGFNVQTGACLHNPAFAVQTYPVEVRGQEVWVEAPAEGLA